jgi:alkylation response protein AidB-like acyl-CoA dehydrogenase
MDFTFDEEHQEIGRLAADVLSRMTDQDRIRAAETSPDGFDRALWRELAGSGLLGAALPVELGGEGLDFIALCLLLEQQGRATAPAPIWPTVVAALAIAEFGQDERQLVAEVCAGRRVLTVALEDDDESGVIAAQTPEGWVLSGRKVAVAAADAAYRAVATAADSCGTSGLFLVDLSDLTLSKTPHRSTTHEPCATIDFDDTPAIMLGEPDGVAAEWTRTRAQLAIAALQLGVGSGALAAAVPYLNERQQFGRPLTSFQAVAHQLADCYIDLEAMRVTLWHAAWRTAVGLPAVAAASVAKWWAGDAGQRVVHRITHLHGGMGVDVDYPIHRYLLWGKQLAATLGGASSELAQIGDLLAGADASS